MSVNPKLSADAKRAKTPWRLGPTCNTHRAKQRWDWTGKKKAKPK